MKTETKGKYFKLDQPFTVARHNSKTEIIQKESSFDQNRALLHRQAQSEKEKQGKTSFYIRPSHVLLQDKETDKEVFKSDHVELQEKETETQEEKF